MKPSTASDGVAKLPMPFSANSARASWLALVAEPAGQHRPSCAARWPCARSTVAATSFATSVLEASAVGQFMTSTASASSASSSDVQRARIALGTGVADDVDGIAARPGRRQHGIERGLRGIARGSASVPPRSPRWSAASTPAPPPLVRIGQPLAGEPGCRARTSAALNSSCQLAHAQHAGAAEGRLVGRVGAGQRAGVRQRCPGARLRCART